MSFEGSLTRALIATLLNEGVKAELVGEVAYGQAPDGTPLADVTTDIYLTAEQLAAALGISPEELDENAPAVPLTTDQLRSALRCNSTPRAVPAWPPQPPKRGSDSYHALIEKISLLEELEKMTSALSGMWDEYGWRGALDVMVAWIIQIEDHPNAADREVRDVDGVFNLANVLVTEPDEDDLLRMAHASARDAIAKGRAPHEAFRRGLEQSQNAVGLARRWLPHFRNAFSTAREELSHNRDRLVFADLYHGPGRNDCHGLIQAAVLLGTAAMGVRNEDALVRLARALAPGRALVDNGEINPSRKTGHKRRPSS